jgi:hypothetical protein
MQLIKRNGGFSSDDCTKVIYHLKKDANGIRSHLVVQYPLLKCFDRRLLVCENLKV